MFARSRWVAALALLAGPAAAQTAPQAPVYHFDLSQADLMVINDALVDLPFRRAAPVIERMTKQIHDQQAAPAVAPASPPK